MVEKLTGRCLCGDIRFRLDGTPGHTSTCHCQQCRRWAGNPWSACNVSADELVLTHGEASLAWYESSDHAERGFCIICGSSLFWRLLQSDENRVAIALGCLDAPTHLNDGEHIHTESKGDYYDLPQQ